MYLHKVQTFWETHKIWKNLPHGFGKSADQRQNHEEDFFKSCVLLKKSELYLSSVAYITTLNQCMLSKSSIFDV